MYSKLLIIMFVLLLLFSANNAALSRSIPIEYPGEYSCAKSADVLPERTMNYLAEKSDNGKVKIWVFFTDRGIKSDEEFRQAASAFSGRLTEKALARRKKAGMDKFTIIDVPVKTSYVDAIVSLGAKLRRTSRYLNAASFEVRISKLNEIAALPFVSEIRPMLGFKKDYKTNVKQTEESHSLGDKYLSYGASYGQLAQVNVVEAHNAGYNGEGVLVAMFDTGFRTTHRVFMNTIMSSRLIAEYDFVFNDGDVDNEPEDWSSAWDHGTMTWSTLGGEWPANHYGPAYRANFILAKTEDVRSETPVEEDNWVAAVEWADSIGADVISSSLGYINWYTYPDLDGNTATTTIAADRAATYGIVVCNSNGNEGSGSGTMIAPADADSILAVGAVYSDGSIVYFSSRGPTYDGRIKPEICAQGVSTACASSSDDYALTSASGTSLSCPIMGGVAALVIQAHPTWTVMQVREAIMMTADNADTPNNTYGWGIANCMAAINYSFGPDFVPGDADQSGAVDIDDVVYLINYLFLGGPAPIPVEEAGDADGSGVVDIDDATYLVNYIFLGGPPPVE